jgi:hypothetical protein
MRVQATSERANFSAGEIAPRLRTRRDLAKHQTGVARLENMVAVLEGVVTRRPGTQFVLPLANEAERAKQIPFRFSNSDSYDIVVNGGVARWFKDGGYVQNPDGSPYELAVPYLEADLPALRWAPSGNAVFIASGKAPQVLTRVANDSWTIAPYVGTPAAVNPQNLDTTKTLKTNFVTGSGTITASAAGIITAADVGTVWRLDEGDLTDVPQWVSGELAATLSVNEERRWQGNVYRAIGVGTGAGPNPPTHDKQGTVLSGKGFATWQWRHKGYCFIKIDSMVSATVFNAHLVGNAKTGIAIAVPESIKATGTYRYWPAAWSAGKGWPDNVRIHQNRLVWFRRDQFWMTESDDFYSFEITPNSLQVPTDASSVPGRFLSPDGSLVENQWALASGVLVIGVRDGEWILRAPNSADAVTITNIRASPDGTEGSASHIPALADGGAAFIGRSRRRLHYIDFDRLQERLQIDEITISARHLLKGRAAGLAWQRDPERVLWTWCEDGTLFGFTFYPKVNPPFVAAHRHPLRNGAVEDMACIAGENGETIDVYLIVRRTIAGATRRYVERLTPFFEAENDDAPDASGAWFVDCGARLVSEGAVTTLSGLAHLEGEIVGIFADGADRGTAIVSGGTIMLDRPASDVTIGLPIDWRVKLLPFELDTGKGPSKNTMKSAKQIAIDVVESAGGSIRCNGGALEDLGNTGQLDYGVAVPLATGPIVATVSVTPELEATIELLGNSTLPFTLAAVAPAVGIGGA